MWALVPVKTFSAAKTRLAPLLTGTQRAALARTMLLDVLDALRDSGRIDGIALVSREPGLPDIAGAYGAVLLDEPERSDLSQAVSLGLDWARAQPAVDTVLVVPGDIPLLQPGDLESLAAAADGHSAITPARDGDGTNALVLQRPFRFTPEFGPGSCQRHLAALSADGQPPLLHHSVGISLDIDTEDDLNRLIRQDRPCRALHLVQQMALQAGGTPLFQFR